MTIKGHLKSLAIVQYSRPHIIRSQTPEFSAGHRISSWVAEFVLCCRISTFFCGIL